MRRLAALALAFALVFAAGAAWAHHAPPSYVKLEFGERHVDAELLVPHSELAHASSARDARALGAYLQDHVSAETPDGRAWRVNIRSAREITVGEQRYYSAEVRLTPPRGASVRQLVFIDDAVTHEVRNHRVLIVAKGELLGELQYPAKRFAIDQTAN
jgi:hypothetical protein